MANSEAKPVDDLSNRSLKKIGELDPKLLESNNEKEVEIRSWKKQKWKNGMFILIPILVI